MRYRKGEFGREPLGGRNRATKMQWEKLSGKHMLQEIWRETFVREKLGGEILVARTRSRTCGRKTLDGEILIARNLAGGNMRREASDGKHMALES